MGDIGGMLGVAGGAGGSGFAAPTSAPISNPTNSGQIDASYAGVQNSMSSQQALLAALQAQNGLGNQTQVYNQLQGVANGTGPNPAQAMLAQSTGQNVANQAALMAGQRGAGANVGLMARQAAQQGSTAQQQAAGQAATLQANQSLNAINAAGSMANTQAANQVGQTNANTSAQQAEQAALLQAQGAYNTSQVGMQSNVNSGNAGLAQTNMQGGQAMIGGLMSGAGTLIGGLAHGGMVHHYAQGTPSAPISMSMPQMGTSPDALQASVNATMAQPTQIAAAPPVQSKFGKFLKGFGNGAAPTAGSAAQGAMTGPGALQQGMSNLVSGIGKAMKGKPTEPNAVDSAADITDNVNVDEVPMAGESDTDNSMMAANGGKVSAMLSPGEKYLSPQEAKKVAEGKENPAKAGKIVPGTPKFKGNNYANDVVPAKLQEGGVVIPNSIMQSADPVRGAADFVRKSMAKKKAKK